MHPINSRNFGSGSGKMLVRFDDGNSVVDGYIVKQLGTDRFRVTDGSTTVDCRLAQTSLEVATPPEGVAALRGRSESAGASAVLVPRFRLKTATVVAGGSGFDVADTITLTGGTGTAIILTVATVNSGAVLTVTNTNLGLYTALPGTVNGAGRLVTTFTTSGVGTDFTVRIVFELASFTISTAGTGYAVGENLIFAGRNDADTYKAEIATVNGSGGITGLTVTAAGIAYVVPSAITFGGPPVGIKRIFATRCVDVNDVTRSWSRTSAPGGTRLQMITND